MSLHDEFIENAPQRAALAAGFRHEDVWLTLLRREDPDTCGVRLTRGDGGIDAYAVVDAASGEMSVYQAKLGETPAAYAATCARHAEERGGR